MVYFRYPFSDKIFTTDEKSGLDAISFISFDGTQICNFSGNTQEISREKFLNKAFLNSDITREILDFIPEEKLEYEKKIGRVIDFVKQENLPKLVISRQKLVEFGGAQLDLSRTFLNLCDNFPNALVYLFMKDEVCWMGAFSEILGKFDHASGKFETMSLAATLPVGENWGRKEIEEQKPVTNFVRETLGKFTDQVQQSETYDHISGNIKHLRTDFTAHVEAEAVEPIIQALHPTPAVCGIPKDFCKKAIADFEDHSRSFYAGYIKVESPGDTQYFVNLRCAEFFKNAALIYVGGGITADSSPQKEWQETELKAQAVLKNLSLSQK